MSAKIFANYYYGNGSPMEVFRQQMEGTEPGLSNYDSVITKWEDWDGVPVLVHVPEKRQAAPVPAMLMFHGGGWGIASANYTAFQSEEMAKRSGIVIANVEYRLAPPHFFPDGLNDCVSATKYLLRNAKKYNVDEKRVSVMGDSAGGNLAAVVALKMRDDSSWWPQDRQTPPPKLAAQILVYPVIQGVSFKTVSHLRHAHEPISSSFGVAYAFLNYIGLPQPSIQQVQCYTDHGLLSVAQEKNPLATKYVKHFVPKNAHMGEIAQSLTLEDFGLNLDWMQSSYFSKVMVDEKLDAARVPAIKTDPRLSLPNAASGVQISGLNHCGLNESIEETILSADVSPIMAESLSNLPHAVILTSEFDSLRDDGAIYAERLRAEGVSVDLHNFACPHGGVTYFRWLQCGNEMLQNVVDAAIAA